MNFKKTEGKSLLEVSEMIRDHLIAQKAQSLTYNDGCAYRGDNDTSCAVGCLISDDEYNERIERKSVQSAFMRELFNISDFEVDILQHWQLYHDGGDYARWCNGSNEMYIATPQKTYEDICSIYNLRAAQ